MATRFITSPGNVRNLRVLGSIAGIAPGYYIPITSPLVWENNQGALLGADEYNTPQNLLFMGSDETMFVGPGSDPRITLHINSAINLFRDHGYTKFDDAQRLDTRWVVSEQSGTMRIVPASEYAPTLYSRMLMRSSISGSPAPLHIVNNSVCEIMMSNYGRDLYAGYWIIFYLNPLYNGHQEITLGLKTSDGVNYVQFFRSDTSTVGTKWKAQSKRSVTSASTDITLVDTTGGLGDSSRRQFLIHVVSDTRIDFYYTTAAGGHFYTQTPPLTGPKVALTPTSITNGDALPTGPGSYLHPFIRFKNLTASTPDADGVIERYLAIDDVYASMNK